MYVPDNYDMFEQHEAEQARQLKRLPLCDYCHEHITDTHYYEFDGKKVCPDCMEYYHKKELEV